MSASKSFLSWREKYNVVLLDFAIVSNNLASENDVPLELPLEFNSQNSTGTANWTRGHFAASHQKDILINCSRQNFVLLW